MPDVHLHTPAFVLRPHNLLAVPRKEPQSRDQVESFIGLFSCFFLSNVGLYSRIVTRKFFHKPHQTSVANNVLVPCVNATQHKRICLAPLHIISTKVVVNNVLVCQTSCNLDLCKQEGLFGMNPVVAWRILCDMASRNA